MKLEAARPNEIRELNELNAAELDAVTGGVSSRLTTWKEPETCPKPTNGSGGSACPGVGCGVVW
jgi:hypothetical protein